VLCGRLPVEWLGICSSNSARAGCSSLQVCPHVIGWRSIAAALNVSNHHSVRQGVAEGEAQ
jgi:hypothetical protein